MKVLMIVSSSQVGGAEKQFFITAKYLQAIHEVSICVLGSNGPYTPLFRSFGGSVFTSSGTKFGDLITILRSFRHTRPDVVITWLYWADLLGSLVALIGNIPCVISARNTQWPRSSLLKKLALLFISKYVCSAIVANSQRAKLFHEDMGYPREKIQVIPNFLDDTTRNIKRVHRSSLTLGLAARPVPGKGHFLAIDALAACVEMFPSAKLRMIGFGITDWRDLTAYISKFNLNIELLEGSVDLDAWYNSIDIYLALSTMWDSDSNSVLESIMQEIPVVCSPLQAPEELMHLMTVVDPEDPSGIAREIARINQNPVKELQNHLQFTRKSLEASRDPRKLANLWNLTLHRLHADV